MLKKLWPFVRRSRLRAEFELVERVASGHPGSIQFASGMDAAVARLRTALDCEEPEATRHLRKS